MPAKRKTKLCCLVNTYIKECIHCHRPICKDCHIERVNNWGQGYPFENAPGPHYNGKYCNGGTYYKNVDRLTNEGHY